MTNAFQLSIFHFQTQFFFPWHENSTLNRSPCDWKDGGIMGSGKHICVKMRTHFRFNWGFNISFCTLSHNDNRLMDFSLTLRARDWWLMPQLPFIFIYKACFTESHGLNPNKQEFQGKKISFNRKKPWPGPWSCRGTLLLIEREEEVEERNRHINHTCKIRDLRFRMLFIEVLRIYIVFGP